MKFNNKSIAVLALMALMAPGLTGWPGIETAKAVGFNPNYIMSDSEIRDDQTMSLWDIRRFLNSKGGLANRFDVDPEDGLLKGSAQLIYDASQRHRVNPKYLLALIQKESSAVETSEPQERQLDFATGYGVCDSCSKDDPLALKNKGLAKQIEAGAGYIEWFWENHPAWPGLPQPGQASRIDGTPVTPANLATAALYGYTPHLHGNRLLSSVFDRWWNEGVRADYPDGSLIRNEQSGQIALWRAGKLRLITSPTVLRNRFGSLVPISVNRYEFESLAESSGPPIRLVEPSLVQAEEDGSTWLLVNNRKRRIASPKAFTKIGFNPEEVEFVSLEEISEYPEGQPLTVDSAAPSGYLAQDPRTGGIWWIEDSIRHPLYDKSLLALAFYGRERRSLSAASIDAMPIGAPPTFPDGSLIKSADDPTVYVISEGMRRPIASETAFIAHGYRWPSILTVSPKALRLHGLGEPLDVETLPNAAGADTEPPA